jgi:ADP-heptose:LPS heptosyltransferase
VSVSPETATGGRLIAFTTPISANFGSIGSNTIYPPRSKPSSTSACHTSSPTASRSGDDFHAEEFRLSFALNTESLNTLLIIKPGSFGDVIHALPCAAAVRKLRPNTRITWLVDERWQPLLADNPVVDQTVVFPREKFRGPTGLLRAIPWALKLGEIRPDVALDLQGLLRSALMAKFSDARQLIGLADAREGARWFYDKVSPVIPGEHSVLRCLHSVETLGLSTAGPPEFPLPPGSPPAGAPTDRPFILCHPFARGGGKSLSKKHVTELCRALQPVTVVLAGTGTKHNDWPSNTVNLLNRTSIQEMIWLTRAAKFVISVDSGPMHIAAAVNPNLLSIHTWSDPRLVGPFSEEAWIWQGGEIRPQKLFREKIPAACSPADPDILSIAEWVQERLG